MAGRLSRKKVLDLGCFAGNNLSVYMAENAKEYIGLDLSDVGIAKLNERIKNLDTAKGVAADFLDDQQFPDKDFDIIYAYGVLHHFQNVEVLISKLDEKLAPNGLIISYDPLETSLPVKAFRVVYRPFQSDRDWEWPFTKKTYYRFKKQFNILDRHGVLGKTKWFSVLNVLPLSNDRKLAIGKKWHQQDWDNSKISERSMFKCMHLTMIMQKK